MQAEAGNPEKDQAAQQNKKQNGKQPEKVIAITKAKDNANRQIRSMARRRVESESEQARKASQSRKAKAKAKKQQARSTTTRRINAGIQSISEV